MPTWVGQQAVAFVPVDAQGDPRVSSPPTNFKDVVTQRVLCDPDPTTGFDRSLRSYFFNVSYGRAILQPTVFDPVMVTVLLPIDLAYAATAAMSNALAGTPFQQACVVFANAPFLDWAFMGLSSSPPNTNVTTYCYDFLSSLVGAWGMENTHTITKFGDLYLTSDSPPGSFDNMSCNCGVHPSTYTKMKLGWLDASEIMQVNSGGATQILHALSLPRPSPPGRITALSFPTGNSQHYFLIEARLRTDPYEAGMSNLSSGIPNEGVVVYEIDEAVPPSPLHLRTTPRALGVGEQYTNSAFQFQVQVLAAVPGGFQVKVQSVENPQCPILRGEIAALKSEIASLQSDLANATGSQKAAIAAEIKQKQGELHKKELEYAGLGCKS